MDDIKNVLYSLIPLILIILFSWLFGMLGSKMKKPTDEADLSLERAPADQPMDIFALMRGEAGQAPAPQGGVTVGDRITARMGSEAWGIAASSGGPNITPKPITPKWWGA